MTTQNTSLQAGQFDTDDQAYDWSVDDNWSNGVPENGADVIVSIGPATADNVANLALATLDLEAGTFALDTAALTVGMLTLSDQQGLIVVNDGDTLTVQDFDDANANAEFVAEAGSQIDFAAASATPTIHTSIFIDGDSGNLAGGAVSIGAGFTVDSGVTIGGSGATLSLDDQTTAVNVFGDAGTINLSGSLANVFGGAEIVNFSSGTNTVDLSNTNGHWDTVFGAGGKVIVPGGIDVSIVGATDNISANGGSWVSLYNGSSTFNYTGSSANIILNDALASISGTDDAINATEGSHADLQFTGDGWDTVSGTGVQVSLENVSGHLLNGGAVVVGGGDTISSDASSTVSLWSTDGANDTAELDDSTIVLNNASSTIDGSGNIVWAYGASSMTLTGANAAWDEVNGVNISVSVYDNGAAGLASVLGGGDTISTNGQTQLSLYDTDGDDDTVSGSNDLVILNDAQASLSGNDDVIDFAGGSSITASGSAETFQFASVIGTASITGFDLSDTVHLNAADWTDFTQLQISGDLTQFDGNTVIALGDDSLTLVGVQASTLTSAQFVFKSAAYT